MGMTTESQFHVLAVDDSLIDRKFIEKLLKTSSFQVTTVDSGTKALEFLGLHQSKIYKDGPSLPYITPSNHQEVEVNLVITDYCMPGMTGYDLLKKIKESASLRNIPVVIMSSENVPSRISRCLEEGAEEFFLKPVRPADVNKLRPHMLRTKVKIQEQEKVEKREEQIDERTPLMNTEISLPITGEKPLIATHSSLQATVEKSLINAQISFPAAEEQSSQHAANNSKRRAMEEGLPSDRTRPRFSSDIATVV